MTNIKIEFPADRPDIARAFGSALLNIANPATNGGDYEEHTTGSIDHDGLNNEGDAVDNTTGAQPGDRGAAPGNEENTTQAAMQEQKDGDAPAAGGDASQVDTKGVPFNSDFCGKAKEPFYASGPRKGQWKKRKGVEDADYDAWYASAIPAPGANTQQAAPLDTSGAFGSTDTAGAFQQQTPQVQGGTPSEVLPTDCGTFMGWVSAQQAAGRLTQQQVTDAYSQLGIEVTSLFPPNDANTIAGHVSQLHGLLSQLAAQA